MIGVGYHDGCWLTDEPLALSYILNPVYPGFLLLDSEFWLPDGQLPDRQRMLVSELFV
jgi:hypothetical protein